MKDLNNLQIFLLYIISLFFFSLTFDLFFITEEMLINQYENKVSIDIISEMLDFREKWKWLGYALLPLISSIKFALISLCIYTGVYLIDYQIGLSRIFKVVLISEFVFLVPALIKLIWFGFVEADYSLTDFQLFMPLSILQIFDHNDIHNWLVYPFSILNVFELLYWFTLAYLLGTELRKHLNEMLRLVLSTYVVGLVLWMVVVTFLNVSLS